MEHDEKCPACKAQGDYVGIGRYYCRTETCGVREYQEMPLRRNYLGW